MQGNLGFEKISELLEYDRNTGFFYWRTARRGVVLEGSVAGSFSADGYIRINILGQRFMAHQLAWLFEYGEFPGGPLDHLDGCKNHNAIANLRKATPRLNSENKRRATAFNQIGVLGVWKVGKRFRAGIGSRGKRYNLGSFDTAEAAHEAYLNAKRRLHGGCTL